MQTPAHNALIHGQGADQVLTSSLWVLNPSEIVERGSHPAAGRAKPSSWHSCTAEDGATVLLPPIPASMVERGDPPGTLLFPSGELLLENLGGPLGQSALSTSPLPRVPFSR